MAYCLVERPVCPAVECPLDGEVRQPFRVGLRGR